MRLYKPCARRQAGPHCFLLPLSFMMYSRGRAGFWIRQLVRLWNRASAWISQAYGCIMTRWPNNLRAR